MQDFQKLLVWHKAHTLLLELYPLTNSFQHSDPEFYRQTRRAVISIESNIAEGAGKSTPRDKANFYLIAFGSASELQSQVMSLRDLLILESTKADEILELIIEVKKMLSKLIVAKRIQKR